MKRPKNGSRETCAFRFVVDAVVTHVLPAACRWNVFRTRAYQAYSSLDGLQFAVYDLLNLNPSSAFEKVLRFMVANPSEDVPSPPRSETRCVCACVLHSGAGS